MNPWLFSKAPGIGSPAKLGLVQRDRWGGAGQGDQGSISMAGGVGEMVMLAVDLIEFDVILTCTLRNSTLCHSRII